MTWDFLPGLKTYLAAVLIALTALNHQYHWVPDSVEQSVLMLATALGIIGARAAVQKLIDSNGDKK